MIGVVIEPAAKAEDVPWTPLTKAPAWLVAQSGGPGPGPMGRAALADIVVRVHDGFVAWLLVPPEDRVASRRLRRTIDRCR